LGKTQQGNNNAYCQDNEISWIDWKNVDEKLLAFTRKVIAMRKKHPVFCRRRWFSGELVKGMGLEDISWFLPNGDEMSDENWNHDFAKSLAVFLNGRGIPTQGEMGEQILDDNFYIIFNAHHQPLDYKLPPEDYGTKWEEVLDSSFSDKKESRSFKAGDTVQINGRSIVVLENPIFEK